MTRKSVPSTLARSIVHRDRLDVRRIGQRSRFTIDLYHRLTRMSWPAFFASFALVFLSLNLVFATLYVLDPHELAWNARDNDFGPFARAFFFSVHTIATVGYGNVTPHSLLANIVVVVEIGCGLLLIALTSGLMFARFSRPMARILFSDVAVIGRFEGVPTLMFRAANERNNFILEAGVRVAIVRTERSETTDANERPMRRFHDLELVRATTPVFALSWLVMHKIDARSPLFGLDAQALVDQDVEIVVSLNGHDSSLAQQIHARHAYAAAHLRWDHDFVDILSRDERGRSVIDLGRFHDTRPLDA